MVFTAIYLLAYEATTSIVCPPLPTLAASCQQTPTPKAKECSTVTPEFVVGNLQVANRHLINN